ncbi:MAG: ribonuclease H-like domain-containing protein [Acidobacteriota bacterium]
MRKDLSERLRAIVRQLPDRTAVRELTFEPEVDAPDTWRAGPSGPAELAAAFGGTAIEDGAAHLVVIDRVYESTQSHGRWRIDACRPPAEAPLGIFDKKAASAPDWSSKPVFFDTETTGLSGGAGTIAFLAGLGWFEEGGFRVRQWLLTSQAGERLLLKELGSAVDAASLLVSYNGRSFDVPLMDMRWAYHRQPSPFDDMPHFDMLPSARKLWKGRENLSDPGGESSCSLSTLERDVLGFHRVGDVPGFEIPARYFQFLRTGDHRLLQGVLDHHRHDIVSLAVLMSYALRLAQDGPDRCRDDNEVVALGRIYERAGLAERALEAFDRASLSSDRYVRAQAFSRLGLLHRRDSRHDEAARAWRGVIEAAGGRRSLFALEREATQALAIHHEHRANDLDAAKKYAETMKSLSSGRAAADVSHRLARLERKLSEEKKKGDPKVAPLLE